MIRAKSRKSSLGQARKLSFPSWRYKEFVNLGPRGRLPVIRPSIRTTNKREVHQALIKNKVKRTPSLLGISELLPMSH